jgi:hypothetical protein
MPYAKAVAIAATLVREIKKKMMREMRRKSLSRRDHQYLLQA